MLKLRWDSLLPAWLELRFLCRHRFLGIPCFYFLIIVSECPMPSQLMPTHPNLPQLAHTCRNLLKLAITCLKSSFTDEANYYPYPMWIFIRTYHRLLCSVICTLYSYLEEGRPFRTLSNSILWKYRGSIICYLLLSHIMWFFLKNF